MLNGKSTTIRLKTGQIKKNIVLISVYFPEAKS